MIKEDENGEFGAKLKRTDDEYPLITLKTAAIRAEKQISPQRTPVLWILLHHAPKDPAASLSSFNSSIPSFSTL